MDKITLEALLLAWSWLKEVKKSIDDTSNDINFLRHGNLIIPVEDLETTINTIEKICTFPYLYKAGKNDIYG